MNISANGKMLASATKELELRWGETKMHWQDTKSREFEQEFLVELIASMERAAPVFSQLDKLVTKIRSDCE